MKLNFNEWFYKYHHNIANDTKWKNMNEKLFGYKQYYPLI